MATTTGLRALDAAHLLVTEILDAVSRFPPTASAELRRQLVESANSVAANISEGFARGTPAERRYRLRIARGSLEETQSHIKVSRDAGYMEDRRYFRLWSLTVVLNRMIAKLILRNADKE